MWGRIKSSAEDHRSTADRRRPSIRRFALRSSSSPARASFPRIMLAADRHALGLNGVDKYLLVFAVHIASERCHKAPFAGSRIKGRL